MDYEKAYKEALERAKSKIKNNKDHVLYEDDIIEMFPELKESEDERIRKELYDFCIKCGHGDTFINQQADFLRWAAWLEKQGEQKPLVIDEGKAEMDYCFTKMMNGEKVSSAWSGEDEKILNTTISFLSEHAAKGYENTVMCMDWLKSLKDRYTWKPSGEQLNALNTLNLHGDISYIGQQKQLIELYEQLKKL